MGAEIGLSDIPGEHSYSKTVLAIGSSIATRTDVLFVAPFKCTVSRITITANASVSGRGTNTRNINVDDTGVGGSGTTEIATLDLASGTDIVAFVPKALTVTATDLAKGQALSIQLEEIGSGRDLPETTVNIYYTAQD